MRESEKKKIQKNSQAKQSVRTPRRENKSVQENGRKPSNAKEPLPKASRAKLVSNSVVSDTNVGTEPSEVYENVVVDYVDDAYRSEDAVQGSKCQKPDNLEDCSVEFSKDIQQAKESDSDYESVKDSTSSQDSDENLDGTLNVSEMITKGLPDAPKVRNTREKRNSGVKQSNSSQKAMNLSDSKAIARDSSDNNYSKDMKVHPSSECSEGPEDKPIEEANNDMFDEASNDLKDTEGGDDDIFGSEDNGNLDKESTALKEKIDIMESRLEKLEDELRVVAALEVSLYSVIPEHGSSAHKVHTPARRLSRLYLHACKHWTRSKRVTIARNTVSGLILISKTCGNDVSRLTFWLSNAVVLREIISQAFGISDQASSPSFNGPNGCTNGSEGNSVTFKLKGISSGKQVNMITQVFEDWEETSTFTCALRKIESWIFSRIVESVWWQALTPNMQSPVEELVKQKSSGYMLGPSLGDHNQGTLSINLWKNAFQGAFERVCPVRAAGHECGCLPVLTSMVMEQCVGRLDVAMFNAILRDSANQIPTDPVSDPIVDSRVLPIPAGEFNFGSGAQLKNSVGNWSRWFSDHLGIETDSLEKDELLTNSDDNKFTQAKSKCFYLLDELSDLLMLPKDMLMDRSIRQEVCPSINLGVVKRILCYFTPDEFCPDPVPGEVLEALNAESYVEKKLAGDSSGGFPYAAPVVSYITPSSSEVSEKVGEARGKPPKFERNVSMVQKKGYMSDEELDDLDSPLESFIEQSSPRVLQHGNSSLKSMQQTNYRGNTRYELLREVWSS